MAKFHDVTFFWIVLTQILVCSLKGRQVMPIFSLILFPYIHLDIWRRRHVIDSVVPGTLERMLLSPLQIQMPLSYSKEHMLLTINYNWGIHFIALIYTISSISYHKVSNLNVSNLSWSFISVNCDVMITKFLLSTVPIVSCTKIKGKETYHRESPSGVCISYYNIPIRSFNKS